jgi:uncharacterized protein
MSENAQMAIEVEVVFATPELQILRKLSVRAGSTVGDAIEAAELATDFPDYCFADLEAGVWGQPATQEQSLKAGDRVEIYRKLERDPKEARRIRARDSVPDPSVSR